jgi:biopolymer transport protein ExbD
MSKPEINVTPLIDVLLVLLIIFMVVTPLKPSTFKARVPAEPPELPGHVMPHPDTLAVHLDRHSSLSLNQESGLGTSADTSPLVSRLRGIFAERAANGSITSSAADDPQRPYPDRVERTVFIKAPRDIDYGSVARVVDGVKLAGGYPISLQIDHLD